MTDTPASIDPSEEDIWPEDGQPSVIDDSSEEGEETEATDEVAPVEHRPLPEFDPQFRDEFNGLLFIGKLEHDFHWMGHEFVIRTLTTDELIEVGYIVKKYEGSMGQVKAYQSAIVGACIITVDGKPLPSPMTREIDDTAVRSRMNYVKRSWYPPTIEVVFEQYLALEKVMFEVVAEMGKA